jgi:glycosyltransferase involved in cell wall biosynthesis
LPSFYTPNALVTMNPELGPMKRKAYRLFEKWLGKLGTILIAVSEMERDHAVALGMPPESVAVVPNGIALADLPDRASVRNELGIDADATVVGFVGRLFAQKAPAVLLRAFAQSNAQESRAILAMVGDGPMRAELDVLAEELGITEKIRWLGARNGQRTMPAFDVFALPSLYEGMPYVALEAAHAGLPIVASRVSGISSVVRDDENGYVVEPGDVGGFAMALDKLLLDPERRERFSAPSLSRVQEWTLDRMVDDTIKVYEQVLDAHAPRSFEIVKNGSGNC